MNLDTGVEEWAIDIPFNSGDWTTWVAGVMNGQVYASRAGNGASVWARLHALDVADGSTIWLSDDEISAGAYDGVVFAPNGDPIIASFQDILRINHADGSTVWHAPRTASVSGNCGAAVHGEAVYVIDAAPGGHVIVRYDLAAGTEMYESELMAGFTLQNTPHAPKTTPPSTSSTPSRTTGRRSPSSGACPRRGPPPRSSPSDTTEPCT